MDSASWKSVPLGGALGAEIRGVDVRSPKDEEDRGRSAEALLDNEVVFFRETGSRRRRRISRSRGALRQAERLPGLRRVLGETEADLSDDHRWSRQPARGGLLAHGRDLDGASRRAPRSFARPSIPERGGDTMWGSMTAAYEALSERMRAFCDGLTVRHDNASFIRGMERKARAPRPWPSWRPSCARRTRRSSTRWFARIPETGKKALMWGGGFMREVVQLEKDGERFAARLPGTAYRPAHLPHPLALERVGDLAIWDERSTVHRGLSAIISRRPREVRRCVIDGDRPV